VSRTVKIAHLYLSMPVGGAEDLTVGLMSAMPPGFAIEPVCLRELGVVGVELQRAGGPVHLLPVAPTKRLNVPGIFRLSRWLREQGFAAVHTQVYNAHVYGVLAAACAGLPAVIHHQKTFRGMRWHRQLLMKWLTRLAPAQITLSEQTRDDVVRELSAGAGRVLVLPNAVDTARFRPPDARGMLRRSLGLDPDKFNFGTVASLTAPKNHAANLAMWGAARAQGLDANFLLCGEGVLRGELEQTAARLDIAGTFRFLGNQRPVHPWVQAMDVFVLCSMWEGQPLAILQALACGLPVLASRIEGNVAVLGAEHPGLFNLGQPDDYVAKALAVRRDPAFRRAIVEFQQTRSPSVPSVLDCARTLSELYQRIVEHRELETLHLLGGESRRPATTA
jgi:glycosyltransferase involved in cell wall biosynthesis